MADSDNEKGKGNGMAVISLLSAVSVAAISNWDKIFQKPVPTPTPTITSTPTPSSATSPITSALASPLASPVTTDPALTIAQPTNGSKVPTKSDFAGTFTNLPKNVSLWLYVYATEEHKYYLREIIDRGNNGNWQLKNVIIGGAADIGSTYKVGVLVADIASTKTLRSNSKGLSQLPSQKKYSELSINRQ
jgi:hypothetical protein